MINRERIDKVRMDIDSYLGNEEFSGAVLVSIEGEKIYEFRMLFK